MKHLPADKYNVAWFKLAEFIVRGERERALGLYRLLVHSFDNQALGFKLEGDILLSFKDNVAAKEKYLLAADLYLKQERIQEAIALYEAALFLTVADKIIFVTLTHLYEKIKNYTGLEIFILKSFSAFLDQKEFLALRDLLKRDDVISLSNLRNLYQKFFFTLINDQACNDQALKEEVFEKTMLLMLEENGSLLQTFMSSLQGLDEHYYQRACVYLYE